VLTQWGNITLEQVESTWNLGLGFAVIVKADQAASIQNQLIAAGVNTWHLGVVESNDCSLEGYIQGAKGVDGGAVRLVGAFWT
jgi:phosphoribosylformylglycinamidine cyclo-ligase